ncbi:hypothetical protein H8L32_16090 [Undibacterium sp. CY18W]|uniref:Uncharacterized protein n=1 Tax=Undibacterium hunanense TaxID=2762292 RepID=A0ABR6ZT32_9BURK|nr:hypothetical protein [Undibacterium hunanense]MBC3919012.1 hypothetical protein [Undibacterium hunanense]
MAGVIGTKDLMWRAIFKTEMDSVLSGPLGSYPDRDEFQIARMLVWVYYLDGDERALQLSKANGIFPAIQADIPKVEVMASRVSGENTKVIGISIKPDGSTIYTCRQDDHEDSIDIVRTVAGRLMLR